MTHSVLTPRLDTANALIARTLEAYPGRAALSVSFGGASGMVLLDIALRIDPKVPVFLIDTGVLFPETHALVERVEQRYGITVESVLPDLTIEEQAAQHGDALWARDPDACCHIRKVLPLRRHLAGIDAWMTAVRRSQSASRSGLAGFEWNEASQVVKVAPLADWSDADVWEYTREYDVPVNTLLYEGYRSIGCTHCTLRTAAGGAERDGRWAGFNKTECGIHEG